MRTLLIPTLSLLACALSAGDAPAGPGPGDGPGPRGGLLAIFDEADANHDGKLTHDEAKAFHEARAKERDDGVRKAFAAGDADQDGALTKDEFKVAMKSLRESMPKPPRPEDEGHGNKGDKHEKGEKHERGEKEGDERGPGEDEGHGKDRPDPFTRMDANKDGKVTLAELVEARDQRKDEMKDMIEAMWKKADADNDGALTKAELAAAAAEHHKKK